MSSISQSIISVEIQHPSQWQTLDPFLYCAHHVDVYPPSAGSGDTHEDLGIAPQLRRGHNLGSDFGGVDGFNMYHGKVIPGFPAHPHYGFETISIAEQGFVDHFDSHGATARYGDGDVQWLTAGAGIQHGEMFPLRSAEHSNINEGFQLWLNLPNNKKQSKPYFSMAWRANQPSSSYGEAGKQAHVRVIGGEFLGMKGVPSPPDSYASEHRSEIIVALITLEASASLVLPSASSGDINRAVFLYEGGAVDIDGREVKGSTTRIVLSAGQEVTLKNSGGNKVKLLLLQGRPLNQPVIQQGPFVTSSREELTEVYKTFRTTQFGGWKWGRSDMVHPRSERRFFEVNGKRTYGPWEDKLESKEREL